MVNVTSAAAADSPVYILVDEPYTFEEPPLFQVFEPFETPLFETNVPYTPDAAEVSSCANPPDTPVIAWRDQAISCTGLSGLSPIMTLWVNYSIVIALM